MYDWVIAEQELRNCKPTKNIADNAISISLYFKDGVESYISCCVHDFMDRDDLCIRAHTGTEQTRDAGMEAVKNFCFRVMQSFKAHNINPHFRVNKETALFLNYSPTRKVESGKCKASIGVGGSTPMRFTPSVSMGLDSTKLQLFVIFKGRPN